MAGGVPSELQQFIFEHIDSIEQLDILLLLSTHADRAWTGEQVAKELRTNPRSATGKLAGMRGLGLLEECGPAVYRYLPAAPALAAVVDALSDACRIRRHQVYELIFSSLKGARKFLDAFTVVDATKEEDSK